MSATSDASDREQLAALILQPIAKAFSDAAPDWWPGYELWADDAADAVVEWLAGRDRAIQAAELREMVRQLRIQAPGHSDGPPGFRSGWAYATDLVRLRAESLETS